MGFGLRLVLNLDHLCELFGSNVSWARGLLQMCLMLNF